jgi:hypothetical protein
MRFTVQTGGYDSQSLLSSSSVLAPSPTATHNQIAGVGPQTLAPWWPVRALMGCRVGSAETLSNRAAKKAAVWQRRAAPDFLRASPRVPWTRRRATRENPGRAGGVGEIEAARQSTAEITCLRLSARWVAEWVASRDRQVGRRGGGSLAAAGSVALPSSLSARALDKAQGYSGKPGPGRRGGRN